jgi:Protein of unknown function (DUF3037)
MDEIAKIPAQTFVYRVIRYTPNLVRDEWVNIGVLLIDTRSGEKRLRLIEGQDEYNRVRRLHPQADEALLRALQEDLESRLQTNGSKGGPANWRELLAKWDATLSNALQLAPPKGVLAENVDEELERLYADHVALQRAGTRPGLPGSRSFVRAYCAQVLKQAGIWNANRIERSIRASAYTFPGDPMRIDFGYRRNGMRGFIHALSVTRSPQDAKLLAYTAEHIQKKAAFRSQFAAVTDVLLNKESERHRFVGDTLRDAGIEPVAMEAFAAWVPKLKAMLQ